MDTLKIVRLDQVSSKQSLRQDPPLGSRTLSYCTAFGKGILAYRPEDDLQRLFKGKAFQPLTPKSIRTYEELKKELTLTQSPGYAVDDEEAVIPVVVLEPLFLTTRQNQ